MAVTKVTSKGQITLPASIRRRLGIDRDSYLEVVENDDEVRLRKIVTSRALEDADPIWDFVGIGDSGRTDVSVDHDRHLAEAEIKRWRGSS
jgi:AbrB family looped-hinge helix DNA binding protein